MIDQSAVSGLGTILGVWAHPDDEAFLSAGLMALAREAGNRVVVATATRGERGTDDPVAYPPERLARLRADELAASLAVLDVVEHRWMPYPDGCCSDVTMDRACAQVARLLDHVGPDTIVTFGPDGMTGHADHQAVSAWTTAAWQATGRRARLLYATVSERFVAEHADLNERYGIFASGPPVTTPADGMAMSLRLAGDVLETKIEALRAHASQIAALHAEVGHQRFSHWWSEESFREAMN